MAKSFNRRAEKLAGLRSIRTASSVEDLRERINVATGNDLDVIELDILCDMVWKKISKFKGAHA